MAQSFQHEEHEENEGSGKKIPDFVLFVSFVVKRNLSMGVETWKT